MLINLPRSLLQIFTAGSLMWLLMLLSEVLDTVKRVNDSLFIAFRRITNIHQSLVPRIVDSARHSKCPTPYLCFNSVVLSISYAFPSRIRSSIIKLSLRIS